MGITAFPFSSVIDVPTARILGRDDAGTGSAEALTTAEVLALLSVYTTAQVDSLLSGKTNTGHTHDASGITSGTLDIARIPLGTTATTVCVGNDARLSDARAPLSHAHGNITNAGAIGTTASLPIITGASGILQTGSFGTTAGTFCQGNDARLSDARTPLAHTHTSADITGFGEAVDDEVATLLTAGTGISLSYNDNANTLTIASTVTPGVGGSTGSTSNAVLRASGTGGATLQASAIVITDNFTSSPNATVNHASIQATGDTTNVSLSVVPKGNGAFCLAVPDGTATGGNARGANAIDLQTLRSAATQVASATNSVTIGVRCTGSSSSGVAIGDTAAATADRAIAIGWQPAASAQYAIAIGHMAYSSGAGAICISNEYGQATGNGATAIGPAQVQASGGCAIAIGGTAQASRTNEVAFGFRHSLFDVRPGAFLLSCKTTNDTFTALAGNNLFQSNIAWTTRTGTVIQGLVQILGGKSDGTAIASYTRKVIFKNIGGTITLVQSETIGTDYEDNASTDLEITNVSPFFRVKGIAGETWRWSMWFGPTLEMTFGT